MIDQCHLSLVDSLCLRFRPINDHFFRRNAVLFHLTNFLILINQCEICEIDMLYTNVFFTRSSCRCNKFTEKPDWNLYFLFKMIWCWPSLWWIQICYLISDLLQAWIYISILHRSYNLLNSVGLKPFGIRSSVFWRVVHEDIGPHLTRHQYSITSLWGSQVSKISYLYCTEIVNGCICIHAGSLCCDTDRTLMCCVAVLETYLLLRQDDPSPKIVYWLALIMSQRF